MPTPPTNGMAMTHTVDDVGPSPEDIASALAELEGHTTSTPSPAPIRTLKKANISTPLHIGQCTIMSAHITSGNPRNGALRSDDHVSLWETVFRSREECPYCGSHWREYQFSAHHHIAGHSSETCQMCEHVFESEEWG